jgi:hypothetical protein
VEFDEITNRIDKLASAQNDNLKLSQRSSAKAHSPVKSLNQSKDSEHQQHQFDLKMTSKQSPKIKEKQIEVRRLSFSSTSSSSTSSLDSAKDQALHKTSHSEHKEHHRSKQEPNEAQGHESYDENEFEKSDSHNSSSSSL